MPTTPSPTSYAPVSSPSQSPLVLPTAQSTSEVKTGSPSVEPTTDFTAHPTSNAPAPIPSQSPSSEPVSSPSQSPLVLPTAQSTDQPTAQPTYEPSASETPNPLATPIKRPSVRPSPSTIIRTSHLPTGRPSFEINPDSPGGPDVGQLTATSPTVYGSAVAVVAFLVAAGIYIVRRAVGRQAALVTPQNRGINTGQREVVGSDSDKNNSPSANLGGPASISPLSSPPRSNNPRES